MVHVLLASFYAVRTMVWIHTGSTKMVPLVQVVFETYQMVHVYHGTLWLIGIYHGSTIGTLR